MSSFTVWVVAPVGDVHFQGLKEVVKGVWYALGELGHECVLNSGPVPVADWGRLVVFNAHRLDPEATLPLDAIVFNAEQVQPTWAQSPYLALLRRHQVWDYCETNRERLKQLGVERVALCRIGHWPGLSNLARDFGAENEEVDVLFVGSVNERRAKLLVQLSFNKLRVKQLFACYGEERDRWIARSKIVLNAHFYPEPVWEVFRCSHLLANKKCVVSESGGVDRELEDLAAVATAYAPYDQIVNTCVNLARDDGRRREIAERGHRVFTGRDQVEYVKQALEASL